MPGSVTWAFSEAADFETALREGGGGLLITGPGTFRARLTRIALLSLRLASAEEHLPRILLVAVPPGMFLVALPGPGEPAPVLGRISMGPGEIMTLGPGERLHMRSYGRYRWGGIWLPVSELVRYGSVMTGSEAPETAGSCENLTLLAPVPRTNVRLTEAEIHAVSTACRTAVGFPQVTVPTGNNSVPTDSGAFRGRRARRRPPLRSSL
jgi:hypothetical protein